jgi:hypothetical protein
VSDATRDIRGPRADGERGYGYLWWVLSDGHYAAEGRCGQFVVVVPEADMVVAITGGEGAYRRTGCSTSTSFRRCAPIDRCPRIRPARPSCARQSQAPRARRGTSRSPPLRSRPRAKAVRTHAPRRSKPGRIETLTVTFASRDQVTLWFTTDGFLAGDREFSWVAGLDGVPRTAPGRFDLPAMGSGHWAEDGTLELVIDEIGNNNVWSTHIAIDDGLVTMELSGEGGAIRDHRTVTSSPVRGGVTGSKAGNAGKMRS